MALDDELKKFNSVYQYLKEHYSDLTINHKFEVKLLLSDSFESLEKYKSKHILEEYGFESLKSNYMDILFDQYFQ